jgi:hypothetical protein
MRPRQNGISRDPGAIDRRKLAAAIWHGQNSEQPTFVNVGGWTDGVICSRVIERIRKKYSAWSNKNIGCGPPPSFFGTPVTMFGSECMYKCPAAPLVRRAVAKGWERWMSLSVNLALGGGNRVIRTQRIC